MNCRNCKAEIEDGDKACRWCGTETQDHPGIREQRARKISLKNIILIGSGSAIAIIVLVIVITMSLQPSLNDKGSAGLKGNIGGVKETSKSGNLQTSVSGGSKVSGQNESGDTPDSDVKDGQDNVMQSVFYVKNFNELMFASPNRIKPQRLGEIPRNYSELSLGISKDGKKVIYNYNMDDVGDSYIFQPDKLTNAMAFYCNISDEQVSKFKIDKEIESCMMNQNSTKFYYLTKSKHLFFNNLNKIEDIDDSVLDYYISANGDAVLYNKDSVSETYLKREGKKKELIGSNINIQYATKDLKEIYYFKDLSLYMYKDGVTTIIGNDVIYVVSINEKGRIYYIKANYDEYSEASNDSDKDIQYSLYYYSEGKSKLVNEYRYIFGLNTDQPQVSMIGNPDPTENDSIVVIFAKGEIKKGEDTASDEMKAYIFHGGTIIGEINPMGASELMFDYKSDKLYYLPSKSKILYYVTVTDKGVSEPVKYAEGVDNYEINGEDIIVYKNVKITDKGNIGDLYINNKLIDHKVDIYTSRRDMNSQLYTFDKDYGKSTMVYDGVKVKKLGEGIAVCKQFDDNKIVYFKMGEYDKGELYLYDGSGNDKLIDDKVTQIPDANPENYGYGN